MKNITIIGSSVLAVHMTSYLLNSNYKLIGYFDDYLAPKTKILDYSVLGQIEDIPEFKDKFDELFIGIGYNHLIRKTEIAEYLYKNDIKLGTYIHNSVYADKTSVIKNGTFILPNCTIDKMVEIGSNVFMNPNCCVCHDSIIGNETFFGPGVIISGNATIGQRCFIGAGSVIKDNIKICDDVTIGAGSVVIKDINKKGVYVGIPARKLK